MSNKHILLLHICAELALRVATEPFPEKDAKELIALLRETLDKLRLIDHITNNWVSCEPCSPFDIPEPLTEQNPIVREGKHLYVLDNDGLYWKITSNEH